VARDASQQSFALNPAFSATRMDAPLRANAKLQPRPADPCERQSATSTNARVATPRPRAGRLTQ